MVNRDSYILSPGQLFNMRHWLKYNKYICFEEVPGQFDCDGICLFNMTDSRYWVYYWLIGQDDDLESGLKKIAENTWKDELNLLIVSEDSIERRKINCERGSKNQFAINQLGTGKRWVNNVGAVPYATVEKIGEDGSYTINVSTVTTAPTYISLRDVLTTGVMTGSSTASTGWWVNTPIPFSWVYVDPNKVDGD